jgi:chaperonin GroEL (HSP60 family)
MEPKNKYAFIQIGIDLSNTVRATLGPRGMNKMVINANDSKPILTNDGATIIKNLAITHPISNMFKSLAESQEKSIGDGTTTATIFSGQLLENALSLLNKKVHPIIIINGYNIAKQESLDFAKKISVEGDKTKIMKTTFGSKINPQMSSLLTNLILPLDLDNLRIAKLENEDQDKTRIVSGYVCEGHTLNDRMPTKMEGNIAILDLQANMDFAKFSISQTDELKKLEQKQRDYKKGIVDQLVANNVKILFYTDTNPQIENYLTDAGIMSVVVYKRDFLDNICKVTGATAIGDPTMDYSTHIGSGKVEYDRENHGIVITKENSALNTLVLCGPTKQVLDETERAVDDVVRVLKHYEKIVYGAGAFEIELANHLREFARGIGGKEQAAIEKYAESVESIPLILAENCGFDAMEILTMLKTLHSQGESTLGVDPAKMISCAKERGIVEPLNLKLHAIASATEVANLILKLDDIYQGAEQK